MPDEPRNKSAPPESERRAPPRPDEKNAQPASPETGALPPAKKLTPEEQMALYEDDLKENDWGHQPC